MIFALETDSVSISWLLSVPATAAEVGIDIWVTDLFVPRLISSQVDEEDTKGRKFDLE